MRADLSQADLMNAHVAAQSLKTLDVDLPALRIVPSQALNKKHATVKKRKRRAQSKAVLPAAALNGASPPFDNSPTTIFH